VREKEKNGAVEGDLITPFREYIPRPAAEKGKKEGRRGRV